MDSKDLTVTKKTDLAGLQAETGKLVPLKEIFVDVKIKGCLAQVDSMLKYHNEEKVPIEAKFTFPVDDGSAVFKFEAFIGERHIFAKIQPKEEARLTYNDAMDKGMLALMLEEDDNTRDIFQCLLGNLPPQTEATLKMSYVIELPQEPDGRLRFTLPTVLNPRYSPGAASSVSADGATYVPASKTSYKFGMTASISGYHGVKSVMSDKLKLNVEIEDNHKLAKVSLRDPFKFDHDLCLLVEYEEILTPQIVLERGDPSAAGIMKKDMVMVSYHPKLQEVAMATSGEYIFVVDRSGMMAGDKIESMKKALILMVKSLPQDCYFNILSFGNNYKSLFFFGSKRCSEGSVNDAVKLLKNMQADMGQKLMHKPLEYIYKKKPINGHPRRVFLLTGGHVNNTERLIRMVKKNSKSARVFALGIGEGVSTSLIQGVSRVSGGMAEFITEQERILPKVISLLRKAMQSPLLDISIDWKLPPDVSHKNIPTAPPYAIYPGERLTLYSELQGLDQSSSCELTVTGNVDQEVMKSSVTFTLSDEQEVSTTAPVHRLASKAQIKILQDEEAIQSSVDVNKLLKVKDTIPTLRYKIVDLSCHANILSKFTAFIAQDTEGMAVKGKMQSRPCPVPTLSHEFVNTLCQANLKCNGLFDLEPDDTPFSSGAAAEAGDAAVGSWDASDVAKDTSTEESGESNFGFGFGQLGKKFAFGKNSQAQNSYASVVMVDIVAMQKFQGFWKWSKELGDLLEMTDMKDLKIKDVCVTCTLIVLAWLCLHCSYHRNEWQMIEIKAISWLSGQQLENKSVEDRLEEAKAALQENAA